MIGSEALRGLEFPKILQETAAFCHSDATRQEALALRPLMEREEIARRHGLVAEIRRLARERTELRLFTFEDIIPVLEALRPEGALLNPVDLLPLFPVLRMLKGLRKQLGYRSDVPRLQQVTAGITGFPDLLDELEVSIDGDGNILDGASPLLADLRVRKRSLTTRIRKRLEEIVRERATAIFLQDDFITQRGGRWVIPVRMDSKGMVPGVVHDVSNSGETAFMEPLEIIPLVNELENLAAEEKAEQIRIVRSICRMIQHDAAELAREFAVLVQVDLFAAVAALADLLGGETPQIGDGFTLRVRRARHPLLVLLARERGSEVVPLDLALGENVQAMVITGPNAGGKTIALKTVGLLLAMALTGIPVPASPDSVFPVAKELLVDIGDEQSIERSLSTFSAHMANMGEIVRRADGGALVLVDELGTGTEPVQGAALGCAILQELVDNGALVIATTHLTEIAAYVHRAKAMTNASMEFDPKKLTPLYRLKEGEPGQSHALEIARRYGLPDRVMERARGMLGTVEAEFHALLDELKEKRRNYEARLEEAAQRETAARRAQAQAEERLAEAERRRRETLERALGEAREIVDRGRREVNAILEEARRERSREAARRLEKEAAELEARLRELRPEEELPAEEIAEGDTVFVATLGYDAQVVSLRHGKVRVRAGKVEFEVPLSGVTRKKGKKVERQERAPRRPSPPEETLTELNLVGMRVDEALPLLERFLNDASLAAAAELRIIHGVGGGTLAAAVRGHLRGHPLVRDFHAGNQQEGGPAVTVVTLS